MVQIYGEFQDNFPSSEERLSLQFSPSSLPLRQRWRNSGLSADFIADYLITFFPGDDANPELSQQQAEIKSAASYVANELIENAMKFHYEASLKPICITLNLYYDKLIFHTTNVISALTYPKFEAFLQRLTTEDPQDLYFHQLEQNALQEVESDSGLGILTMINDYMAKIGWKFETLPDDPDLVSVTTVVQIDIEQPQVMTNSG